jgi:PAS domain S-box-containing protein
MDQQPGTHPDPHRPAEPAPRPTCCADAESLSILLSALREETGLLRTLIDNMPDFIFIKDEKSRFVTNNKAHLSQMLGVSAQSEAVGKTDFDFFAAEQASRYFADERTLLASGVSIVDHEEPADDRFGRRVWLSTTKVPIRNRTGQIVGLVGMSRDISERKGQAEALRKSNDELEQRVADRTADLREVNQRLQARLSQLHFLTTTSYELAQFIRLEELGPAVVRAFAGRFARSEIALCLRRADGFWFLAGSSALTDEPSRHAIVRALAPFVASGLQGPFMHEDWTREEALSALRPSRLGDLLCYCAIPLLADNRLVGLVQVFTARSFVPLYDGELPVLTTLAAHAASCLSNAIHYHELGEQARVQGELDAARTIQQQFTPSHKPHIPRVAIHSVYHPANEVSGDYLDYFQTDAGDWVVVIADVCGKGIPAALFMVMLRSVFRLEGRTATSARKLLCAVNDAMRANLDDRSFVTAVCLVISADGTSMSCARAGHPMVIRIDAGTSHTPEMVRCSGLALGLVSDNELFASSIEEITIPLQAGSRFLLYTDGVTEVTGSDGQTPYGIGRLMELLARNPGASPETIIDTVLADVKTYSNMDVFQDDLTMLAMEVTG